MSGDDVERTDTGADRQAIDGAGWTVDSRTGLRVWASEALFGAAREVLIEHEGDFYRLRKTRLGRLILQK